MSQLVWDAAGAREFETGVDKAVLYLQDGTGAYPKGVAWSGITGVTETPSGAEATALYADNMKYLNLISAETFGATVEAYMYPDEFKECNGETELAKGVVIAQQSRKSFGLCYRTRLGNDIDGDAAGYKIHMIYGAKAATAEKAYKTVNDSPEAITFSWSISTTPVNVAGMKPTALLTIDSTDADPTKLKALEEILYGSASSEARLPLPDEVATIMGVSQG